MYRCDTFIADAFDATSSAGILGTRFRQSENFRDDWERKVSGLLSGVITPVAVFEKLRNF